MRAKPAEDLLFLVSRFLNCRGPRNPLIQRRKRTERPQPHRFWCCAATVSSMRNRSVRFRCSRVFRGH